MTQFQQGDRANNHPAVAAPHSLVLEMHTPWWKHAIEITLLLLMMCGDIVTLFLTMNIVFEEDPIISGMLTAALVGAAVLMMEQAGSSARKVKAKEVAYGWLRIRLLIAAWAGIGIAAFVIRWNAANDLAATGSEIADAGTSHSATSSLSALLLLALYIASGVVAYHLGFSWHQPAKAQLKVYRKQLDAAQSARNSADDQARMFSGRVEFAKNQLEQCRVTSDALLVQIGIEANAYRERARLLLAEKLQDPGSTSGVTDGGSNK